MMTSAISVSAAIGSAVIGLSRKRRHDRLRIASSVSDASGTGGTVLMNAPLRRVVQQRVVGGAAAFGKLRQVAVVLDRIAQPGCAPARIDLRAMRRSTSAGATWSRATTRRDAVPERRDDKDGAVARTPEIALEQSGTTMDDDSVRRFRLRCAARARTPACESVIPLSCARAASSAKTIACQRGGQARRPHR